MGFRLAMWSVQAALLFHSCDMRPDSAPAPAPWSDAAQNSNEYLDCDPVQKPRLLSRGLSSISVRRRADEGTTLEHAWRERVVDPQA
ncbi:hypothetical protein GE09DRAFT_1129009 [Coniochaeta sp. 2T2.1]|nr:hypothetical protein GE09DRAFT_1129009 [Coniochaeta sp. 2T2.1]